jgi:hypothetical protein
MSRPAMGNAELARAIRASQPGRERDRLIAEAVRRVRTFPLSIIPRAWLGSLRIADHSQDGNQ